MVEHPLPRPGKCRHLPVAGINIQVYDNYILIPPSFYNDMSEIEFFISVLKRA